MRYSAVGPGRTRRSVVFAVLSDGGPRNVEAAVPLRRSAEPAGGIVFGSSAGFRLPDGSLRSPDASWLSRARLEAMAPEDRTKFRRSARTS